MLPVTPLRSVGRTEEKKQLFKSDFEATELILCHVSRLELVSYPEYSTLTE